LLAIFIGDTTDGKNPWRKYLYITYSVDKEIAIFSLRLKLNKDDFFKLKKSLLFLGAT
jgi:hypothetical protein